MKKLSIKNRIACVICFLALLFSCSSKSDDQQVYCTLEFRIISVEVQGRELTSYYTIREATQDTIHFMDSDFLFMNAYPILTDGEFEWFETDVSEQFRFLGFIEEEKVIDEPYLISADRCHVHLVEGKTQINLPNE